MKTNDYTDARRVVSDMQSEARKEKRRLAKARREFVILSLLVALLLSIDYFAAALLFDYLSPSLGGVPMNAYFLALTVPVAVIAIHVLLAEDGGASMELRLRRLARVGVLVFLLGIASMLSLVYLMSTQGLGTQDTGSAISGTIGGDNLSSGTQGESFVLAAFRSLLGTISPIIFFFGFCFILYVTVYLSHWLMTRIGQHYDFFHNASDRSKVLKAALKTLDALLIELRRMDVAIEQARRKLPADPEQSFSQIAAAEMRSATHEMTLAARWIGKTNELFRDIGGMKVNIPDHIKTREEAMQVIAAILHVTNPYSILTYLGGLPPREED